MDNSGLHPPDRVAQFRHTLISKTAFMTLLSDSNVPSPSFLYDQS